MMIVVCNLLHPGLLWIGEYGGWGWKLMVPNKILAMLESWSRIEIFDFDETAQTLASSFNHQTPALE